jgi:DNA-binding transcriptional LysR family regulator
MFENLFSIGGLSIDRLKSLIDVAEMGSIARVADGDPSRQSLISRQIGELESFFGVELTKRKGKGLEFTEAGRELARQVRLQFQGLSDFKAACAGQPVAFRVAVTDVATGRVVEGTVEARLRDGGVVHLATVETHARRAVKRLGAQRARKDVREQRPQLV